ncbi:hypothetical protein ACLKA6_015994 [Drosophila palustris]
MSPIRRRVQLPLTEFSHLACHCKIVLSRCALLPAVPLDRSCAKRSSGIIPATTSAAASETVRKAQDTLKAHRLYTALQTRLYDGTLMAGTQIVDPYSRIDLTTPAISLLLCCLGPLVFANILLMELVA